MTHSSHRQATLILASRHLNRDVSDNMTPIVLAQSTNNSATPWEGDPTVCRTRCHLFGSPLDELDFALGHGCFGIEFGIGIGKGNNLSAQSGPFGKKTDIHGGPAAPQVGKRLVDDDAGKPSPSRASPRKESRLLKART